MQILNFKFLDGHQFNKIYTLFLKTD